MAINVKIQICGTTYEAKWVKNLGVMQTFHLITMTRRLETRKTSNTHKRVVSCLEKSGLVSPHLFCNDVNLVISEISLKSLATKICCQDSRGWIKNNRIWQKVWQNIMIQRRQYIPNGGFIKRDFVPQTKIGKILWLREDNIYKYTKDKMNKETYI